MRKTLLTLSVAAALFAGQAPAFAADQTAQEKYDALVKKGIFAGIDGEAALDQNMNRAQFARVSALLLGLPDISATDTNVTTEKPFSDVELGMWYTAEIAAAKQAGILMGNADGTFNPRGDITVQELAVLTARLLGLAPVEGARVEGAADWAAGYIKAIQNAGVDFPTNYTQPATRSQLAALALQTDTSLEGTSQAEIAAKVISDAVKAHPDQAANIVADAIKADPTQAALIVKAAVAAAPDKAADITKAAIAAAPDQSDAITRAAISAAPSEKDAIEAAAKSATDSPSGNFASNTDPSVIPGDSGTGGNGDPIASPNTVNP